MNTLLQNVFDAYGGPDRWRGLTTLTGRVTFGGPFWASKGRADFASTDRVEANLQTQRIRFYQEYGDLTIDFDKTVDSIVVSDADGTSVEALDHPRRTFYGLTAASGWSRAQAAYFQAYATSHYLVEPYIFTWDGVETCEIAPWEEDGQSWRGLAVTFPRSLDTHSRTQLYYFDDHDLLRRMDYQAEVLQLVSRRALRQWSPGGGRCGGCDTAARPRPRCRPFCGPVVGSYHFGPFRH